MARKLDEPQERGDFFKSLGTPARRVRGEQPRRGGYGLGPQAASSPGALDELEFLTKCTRCDKCMRACPENAILLAPPSAGLALRTPYIDPRSVPCFLCTTLPASPPARMRP